MSSKSSSSSKSFIAMRTRRRGRVVHEKKRATFVLFEKREDLSLLVFKARFIASFIYRFFPFPILSLIKKGSRKEDKTRERKTPLLFRTVTTCPSLSCMSLTGTPTPFPLRPTLLLMTTDDNSFLIKRRSTLSKKEVLYGLGFLSLGFVSS